MGKGGGCTSSTAAAAQPLDASPPVKAPATASAVAPASSSEAPKAAPAVANQPVATPAESPAATEAKVAQISDTASTTIGRQCKIYVIVHTLYGHAYQMSCALAEGIREVEGCSVEIFQVAETLSQEVLTKMYAAPKPDAQVITARQLPEADGLVFGYPTRFGMPCAQMLEFLSTTDVEWLSRALLGKPVTAVTSVGGQGGGIDTTTFTCMCAYVAHGMIYVPPAAIDTKLDHTQVHGCGAWGAGTVTGLDGSRQPSAAEKEHAKSQGVRFAGIVKKLSS